MWTTNFSKSFSKKYFVVQEQSAVKNSKFSFQPILSQKSLAENQKFWPNLFGSELAEMKIWFCNWHMAIKTYFISFFHLLLKNSTSQSKFLQKRRFCDFFSFGHVWKIFILPFLNAPGYTLFKKYNVLLRHFRLELLPFQRDVFCALIGQLFKAQCSESLKYVWKSTNCWYQRKVYSISEFFRMFKDANWSAKMWTINFFKSFFINW